MSTFSSNPVTQLLAAAGRGDGAAFERLWQAVYRELHCVAEHQLAAEHGREVLQPTELVHEAFLRLMPRGDERFENRRHFFTAAAIAMRRIRVDDARRISRIKRGGGGDGSGATDGSGAGDRSGGGDRCATVAHEGPSIFDQDPNEVLAIGDALEKLERVDPAKAAVVNFRYFSGFTVKETASALGISPRKVNLEWRLARAWLHRELGDSTSLPES